MKKPNLFSRGPGLVSEALHKLVSQIPASAEVTSDDPNRRANELAKNGAIKAAAISGSFSLPFGPMGLVTVIPDLLAIWRIQQQLVADIAATFGKTQALSQETMVYCLFKHGGSALVERFFVRTGDNIGVQRIANRTLQQLLEKIAIRVTQRLAAKSVSRWLPILGALGAGAYAYYDTTHVGTNAIELFSKGVRIHDLEPADAEGPSDEPAAQKKATPKRSRSTARAKRSPSVARPRARKSSNGKSAPKKPSD